MSTEYNDPSGTDAMEIINSRYPLPVPPPPPAETGATEGEPISDHEAITSAVLGAALKFATLAPYSSGASAQIQKLAAQNLLTVENLPNANQERRLYDIDDLLTVLSLSENNIDSAQREVDGAIATYLGRIQADQVELLTDTDEFWRNQLEYDQQRAQVWYDLAQSLNWPIPEETLIKYHQLLSGEEIKSTDVFPLQAPQEQPGIPEPDTNAPNLALARHLLGLDLDLDSPDRPHPPITSTDAVVGITADALSEVFPEVPMTTNLTDLMSWIGSHPRSHEALLSSVETIFRNFSRYSANTTDTRSFDAAARSLVSSIQTQEELAEQYRTAGNGKRADSTTRTAEMLRSLAWRLSWARLENNTLIVNALTPETPVVTPSPARPLFSEPVRSQPFENPLPPLTPRREFAQAYSELTTNLRARLEKGDYRNFTLAERLIVADAFAETLEDRDLLNLFPNLDLDDQEVDTLRGDELELMGYVLKLIETKMTRGQSSRDALGDYFRGFTPDGINEITQVGYVLALRTLLTFHRLPDPVGAIKEHLARAFNITPKRLPAFLDEIVLEKGTD